MKKKTIKGLVVSSVLWLAVSCVLPIWTRSGATTGSQPAAFSQLEDTRNGQVEQEKPAEQVFKNIRVFKGLPASQLRPAMSFIAASLGVNCEYCHTNPWDSDVKPTKQRAREMFLMMRKINQENFNGSVVVNCATCHKGKTTPGSIPPFGQSALQDNKAEDKKTKTPITQPTVEQIFDTYIQALGGRAALDKLTTRAFKASEVSTDGTTATVEVYAKAPNLLLSISTANPPAKGVYVQGFNGTTSWSQFNSGRVAAVTGLELSGLTRDAEFYKGLSYFKQEFARITLKGKKEIGGREVYVIEGMNSDDFREDLFFDTNTGLLIGRYGELKTVLGQLAFQADYEDYREVDGVKLPFTIRWALPGNGWTDRITEIKHNVSIDNEKFAMPTPSPGKSKVK